MAAWFMGADVQTEEVDEFEVAKKRSPKRSSSPSKRIMRAVSKVISKGRRKVPQTPLDEVDENGMWSAPISRSRAFGEDEYTESSDCVLLDGLVDMYCGGQHRRRRSAEDYSVNYFKAEDAAEWPLNLEDSCSSLSSFASVSTAATTSTTSSTYSKASKTSVSSSGSSSTILSL